VEFRGRSCGNRIAGTRPSAVFCVYDRFQTNDWTWSQWTYSDATQVLNSPTQVVHFISVALNDRFR